MGREEAYRVVDLCACIDDVGRMVGEAREVDAVFLALELFGVLPEGGVVDLQGFVVACYYGKVAGIVKVDRGDGGLRVGGFEFLSMLATRGSSTGEGAPWPAEKR